MKLPRRLLLQLAAGAAALVGFIAGIARMAFLRFAVFNLIGAMLWVGWWTGLSYYFGKRFNNIFLESYFVIGIITLVLFLFIACRFSKDMNNKLIPKNQPAV